MVPDDAVHMVTNLPPFGTWGILTLYIAIALYLIYLFLGGTTTVFGGVYPPQRRSRGVEDWGLLAVSPGNAFRPTGVVLIPEAVVPTHVREKSTSLLD